LPCHRSQSRNCAGIGSEELLRLGVRQSEETHVCLQPNYEPWAPRNLSSAFIKFIKASGLRRVPLHDLRHSHATHLLMANVHPKIVQERLGHANIATTMDLYTHVMRCRTRPRAALMPPYEPRSASG
jgi:integrase